MSPPGKVPPPVLAWVEQILGARNQGGRVPEDLFWQILDDMADASDRIAQWSCQRLYEYGLHANCRRDVHDHHRSAA